MKNKIIIGIPPSNILAKEVARVSKIDYATLKVTKFPDNELHIRYPVSLTGKKVFLFLSLFNPNEKIVELLFTAMAAKEMKAKKVVLIAPYFPYLREDKLFHKGEIVSARILAKLISKAVDELITIDPHLHRIKSLSEIFDIKTQKLSCNKLISNYIKNNYKKPLIIGPDKESYQWARNVAKLVGCEAYVFTKKRLGSEKVKIHSDIKKDLKKYDIIIVDDIISTGHTIVKTVNNLKRNGAKNISCICVHGLLLKNSMKRLKKAGIKDLVTTNTIPNLRSKIQINQLIAEKIK